MMSFKKYLSTAACGVLLAATLTAGAQVVVRIGPPPPAPVEVIPASPGPGWGWHNGYHRWDGQRYVWVPGVYERTPYQGAQWVPGHWANRGGGYVWIEGHWHH